MRQSVRTWRWKLMKDNYNGEKRLINFMCLPVCRHQVDVSIHRLPGKEEHLQRERVCVCMCVCVSFRNQLLLLLLRLQCGYGNINSIGHNWRKFASCQQSTNFIIILKGSNQAVFTVSGMQTRESHQENS